MGQKPKILIIEDDLSDYQMLSAKIAETKKYEIVPDIFDAMGEAFDPNKQQTSIQEYIKGIIKTNFNDNLKLIICDLDFGGHNEGHNLIHAIRDEKDYEIDDCKYFTALIPIIVFTNYPENTNNAINFGANLSIIKPSRSGNGNLDNEYKERNETIMNNLLATIDSQIKLFEKTLQTIEGKFIPSNIKDQVISFKNEYKSTRSAFIMSSFSDNHKTITRVIQNTLQDYGIRALVAEHTKDKYLLQNIEVYMYGCDFGIGVFTHIDDNKFNLNTSFEVGYMMGLSKNVLLLKEKHFERLQSDLDGLLWESFDAFNIEDTIPQALTKWLKDMKIISNE
jgi:nucleoside 2-deoxyribosyltransferase/CheY-like chemotaxis protein